MKVIISSDTDKKCVICGRNDARIVSIPDEDFRGPLCKDHVWEKSGTPANRANVKELAST